MANVNTENDRLLKSTPPPTNGSFDNAAAVGNAYTAYPTLDPVPNDVPESVGPGVASSGHENQKLIVIDEVPHIELHPINNMQAMMNLFKGNIGTGILAMPTAFMNAGLWVGFGGTLLIGVIAVHCMHMLVNTAHHLSDKYNLRRLDYGAVGVESFKVGPEKLRWMSAYIRLIVNIFLCITQFGFCVVYILFIADNCQQVVETQTSFSANIRLWQFFVFLALIPFTFIRTLKYLSPFSAIANLVTAVGLVIILQHCVYDLPPVGNYPAFNSWMTLPLFFGTVVYAFEGIGVVLPIENKMKTPKDFAGLDGVLNTAMVIVAALYAAVGFYGYLKFGDDVQSSITLNLPSDDWLYLSVKLMFAFSIYVSYGVQFYVGVQVTWLPLERWLVNERLKAYGELILRVSILCLTFLLAVLVPHLDLMISLIGAFSSSALAILFPCIFELLCYWGELSFMVILKDVLIILFGFVGFVTGTVTTMIQIRKNIEHEHRRAHRSSKQP